MTSNIRVQKVCQYCGKVFTAKTTVTQYCSTDCGKKAYKAKTRAKRIQTSNLEFHVQTEARYEALNKKDFLTVPEASKLLNCSRKTLYRLVNTGRIKSQNLSERKTLIRRVDIDLIFEEPQSKEREFFKRLDDNYYTISEILYEYPISEKALYEYIKRFEIPKIKKGKYVFVPKSKFDELFNVK